MELQPHTPGPFTRIEDDDIHRRPIPEQPISEPDEPAMKMKKMDGEKCAGR
jgi:hypothetical protein